jgi:hypothetical protein
MIRLGPYRGPDLSSDPYAVELRRGLFEFLRQSPEFRRQRRAPIPEDYFYSQPLVDAVADRCLRKCFFCESDDTPGSVDHFRPTRDAKDLDGTVAYDFYAWLAFETDNLIYTCHECRAKKDTNFPVKGERAPYIASLPEVRRLEEPLLVDAYHDHPDRHFDFLVTGDCVPLTAEGRVTVGTVDLNRARLVQGRAESIAKLLHALPEAIDRNPLDILELLDQRRPFAGASLNAFKRLLQGVAFREGPIIGPVSQLPRRFLNRLEGVTASERQRLISRIPELEAEDRERADVPPPDLGVALEPPMMEDVVARPAVERLGGMVDLSISDFKGIGRLSLSVPLRERSKSMPCLMLLGENAVGKSSILQGIALALIGDVQARRLRLNVADYFRSESSDRWDQLDPRDASVGLQFRYGTSIAEFKLDGERRAIMPTNRPRVAVLGYGPRRFFDRNRSRHPTGAYSRVQTLFSPTAAIPYPGTWLNGLELNEFNQVAQVMRVVLSLDEKDDLVRDRDGRICISVSGKPIPVEWLSEGYRSIFVMVADILRELLPSFPILEDAEAIVLIDEIETHLHPRWKMRVMSSLRRALPRVQFIVTTHDPLCLRGMDDGEVVVLQRDAEGEITKLENLPSIKGMRADQLLTSDYFGLSSTIDPESELGVARYVDQVTKLPEGEGKDADDLIEHLTLGDDAPEQVMHEAMRRFIAEREKPTGKLRTNVREEAVQSILAALKGDLPRDPG